MSGNTFGGSALPLYQCHKRVRACRIGAVVNGADGWTLHPSDQGIPAFALTPAYIGKHAPMPGGYFVVYSDGYQSYSPGPEFDSGYTAADALTDRRDALQRQLEDVNAAIAAAARKEKQ